MSEHALTRRSFLAGTAGIAAAASGFMSFGTWEQAHASESDKTDVRMVHSLCNACSSKCGFTAYVKDGRLTKLIGDEDNPNAKGKLCARGYGYSQIAYSEDRLTQPLKRNDQGSFEPISWDQAFAEIGEKTKQIISEAGPEALALVHDPRPSGKFYCKRFMNALGSANIYTHGAACTLSKEAGLTQVIGTASFSSDIVNSQMTMFIGRSYADGIRPSMVAAMEKAHENGADIIIVDPRCNNSIRFATEWVPIIPGTDLALILAMSHVLVYSGRYDKSFVDKQTVGFAEWKKQLKKCTPEWAAKITGIDATTITRLATMFANAAPAASIESSWRGAFGCAFENSGETARAICCFNALLGCWNRKGGALLTPSIAAGDLDPKKFPKVPDPASSIVGSKEYPLALPDMGSNVYAAQMAQEGKLKGMFFYNSNMAAGYSNPAFLKDALSKLELMVVIDVQMSETAELANYILPDTSYLERRELPEFISGKTPAVALRDKVLDVIHPNTKPIDEIFTGLAQACGAGKYFEFGLDQLANAELVTVGCTLKGLQEVGTQAFPELAFKYDTTPIWKTPTGKFQFASEACKAAGLSATPGWVAPKTQPAEGEFRLIGGKQAIHTHTQTANIADLMAITKQYQLERIWMNEDDAAALGIADGNEVEMSNELSSGKIRVKVTKRLIPGVVFIPSAYGCKVKEQHIAYDVGLSQMDFVPFNIETGYGSCCSEETSVKIKKVGE